MDDLIYKINTALLFLKEGKSFSVGGLRLGFSSNGDFYVTGGTQYLNIENITKYIAIKELNSIKLSFQEMIDLSEELKEFVKDRRIKFKLAFHFHRNGILICSESDGIITWGTSWR